MNGINSSPMTASEGYILENAPAAFALDFTTTLKSFLLNNTGQHEMLSFLVECPAES